MKFPAKQEIREVVEKLMAEDLARLGRGDVLTHEAVEAACGYKRYTISWKTVIDHLKRRMRVKRNIIIWPEPGVGYRLCTVSEQIHMVPLARQRRARRQQTRAIQALEAAAREELTDHERLVVAMREQALRQTRRALTQSMNNQSKLLQRPEQLPRPGKGKP